MLKFIQRLLYSKDREYERALYALSSKLCQALVDVILRNDGVYIKNKEYDIYELLHVADNLACTSSLPDSEFLIRCLSVHLDDIDNYIASTKANLTECGRPCRKYANKTIKAKARRYVVWISKELATKGYVTAVETVAFIDTLR